MKKLFLIIMFTGSVGFSLAQNVGVDVASPQQKLDVAGALKIGSTTTGIAGSLRWTGTAFQFHDGTQWVTLNANTDDQVLDVIQLNGTDLEISVENDGQGTHSIDLSSFLDNTDSQQFDQVTINGSNQLLLSISNDGQATHVLDLSGYLDNTDEQQFDVVQLVGTNLQLSLQNDGVATHVVDLSSLAIDTDDQAFDVAQLTGTNLELSLEDDGVATEVIDLSGFLDNTDDQQFDVVNITSDELRLSLESDGQATHVLDLSPYKDNTDDQQFDVVQLVGNTLQLSLEDDGQATHSIDLSGFADNTDDQQIDVLSLTGNTLNISLENDGQPNQTLDLSQFADNTDDQAVTTFSLSGTDLQLQVESDAGGLQSVDLDPLRRILVDDDGDTKVEVEATADEDQIRFSTDGGEAMRINTTQQVGIGVATGIENRLSIFGSASDTRSVLGLRGGNGQSTFADGAQIAFGYNGDDSFQHFIHTRHNSNGSTNNAIDFYVTDGTQYNTVSSGSTHVMSLNSGNVGIGVTNPGRKLDVQGGGIRVSGLSSANLLVISDADGDLVNLSSLAGTGMGDNLGNHTATTTIVTNGNDIDFVRGDLGQIRSVGAISFDWTSGSYDTSPNHGIESKNESGSFGDELRINSFNDIVHTIDANNNDATSVFKVQHHSTANGADLFQINSPDGRMWFGRGDGSNRMYLDDDGIYLYNGWFRNHGGTGLYNQSYGNHWYATDANHWISRSNRGIVLRNVGNTTRGYLYHNDGDEFGLRDRDGNWAVRTVRDQYVELRDNDEVTFRAGAGGVNGDYGSVSTYGFGKNGWEGYNINNNYVFMSSDANTMGLYNDVDNRWVVYHQRNDRTDFYEPDGGAVSFRVDNNENQMFRDLNMTDDDIWDVERLTVNTIYDTDGTDIVHFDQTRVRIDVGSSRDTWFENYAGHPHIRPGSAGWGFIGRFNNYWYEEWVVRDFRNQEYGFSDRRVKDNIRYLDGNSSLSKIMSLKGAKYDLNLATHPLLGENPEEHEVKDNLGFIAQELKEVVPEMVVYHEETGYYMIKNYEQLLPIMVEAMKEQQRQIEALKNGKPFIKTQSHEDEELSELIHKLIETTEKQQLEIESLKSKLGAQE